MKAIKFADAAETELDILLLPFGGIHNGRDLSGEYFSAKSDFCLDWYPDRRPLLFHHGIRADTGTKAVGHIEPGVAFTDEGGWVKARLDEHNEYYGAIKQLIAEDALGASSGAMSHLVVVAKSGHIDRWPLVEGSLTPTPCNVMARVDEATAKGHFKAIGIDLPDDPRPALKASPRVADDPLPAADPERSYEDRIGDLRDLLNPPGPYGPDAWTSVLATYPDHVLACRYDFADDGDEPAYYDIPYALGADGEPALGRPRQVEQVWVPLKALASIAPLSSDAAHLARHAHALVERTTDLHQRRVKSGRTLSAANRTLIADAVKATTAAAEGLQALLDATDPEAAKAVTAADVRRMQVEGLALYAATL